MARLISLTDEQAAVVATVIEAEVAACQSPTCRAQQHGPRHFSGYLQGHTFVNNGCESKGRHLSTDVAFTGRVVFTGHSHCTCDTCF